MKRRELLGLTSHAAAKSESIMKDLGDLVGGAVVLVAGAFCYVLWASMV